jgi:hypothetical protein
LMTVKQVALSSTLHNSKSFTTAITSLSGIIISQLLMISTSNLIYLI